MSETNERAAIRRVASAATNILAGYGTTEEEDLERLGDVDPVVLGIVDPEIKKFTRRLVEGRFDGDREVIVASDGVWDALGPRGFPASWRPRMALRVRERRMLRGAVLALRDRAETLGALDFQVEEKDGGDDAAARRTFETHDDNSVFENSPEPFSSARFSRPSTSTSCDRIRRRRTSVGEGDDVKRRRRSRRR